MGMTRDQIQALQTAINAAGYTPALTIDGILGPRTRAGMRWFAARAAAIEEAPTRIPPLTAWLGRSGIYTPDRHVDALRGLVDEVSVFLHGLEHSAGGWFERRSVATNRLIRYEAAGIRPVPMIWAFRPVSQPQQQVWREAVRMAHELRTDLEIDCEHTITRWQARDRAMVVGILQDERSRGWAGRVRVNDYASLQAPTRDLILALRAAGLPVVGIPQAYSVDSLSYTRDPAPTAPGGIHWPGRTQEYAAAMWAPVWEAGAVRMMGIAAYKQNWRRADQRGMDAEQSIRLQVRSAVLAGATRIPIWEGRSLAAPGPVRETVEALISARGVNL